ncbi:MULTISPECIES: carbohydrate ABC transporter permease [unclassified Rathayibacter]|uniref:carbohydrate ABC transporter permease n=1 Tax=unclassified Rathayibacter TaxID=2609250 RepID=UPI0006F3D7EF|nr:MULTISPECIES: sugar ABC transporter permease [unclassified Rathayibacter]KQQ05456.1 ABC transporter substrate-binding protein [Rathayibacter sp. Leaf294]KQS13319.1 ABC transporter substrate-binding protein [Rathayibacter sp. Leaf185]
MTLATSPPRGATIPEPAPAPVPRRRRRGDGPAAAAFLAPSLGGFAIFTALPILASVAVAFTVWPLAGSPTFTGIDNFVQLLTRDPAFLTTIANTLLFVVVYVPLNLALSMAIAAWISPRIRGGNVYRVLLFIPVVTPMVANAAVWQIMLIPSGLIDGLWQSVFGVSAPNFLGSTSTAMLCVVLMSLWQGFGYNLLIFSSSLQAVPESLMDSASIDGAGAFRRFFSIKMPLMSPSIFFAATMTLITSFQVFAQPFVLTNGGPGSSTTTMVMYLYRTGFQFFNLGLASAVGVILFVMILAITGLMFLAQKKLVHYE